ncbi:uncharacterized protein KY384_006517 [Bacidia gigantensis]|uniref:uncharacterized protein n=1 Tax=Bacidia gigantensis TaxID=2732470 RepID=UPI001D055174|nr:uncharacterized protein KY384_006517 [Bacidia gigantensis]KAG8528828.1 hypothetical protein KY384_006517 [Bacidia gigantensis]
MQKCKLPFHRQWLLVTSRKYVCPSCRARFSTSTRKHDSRPFGTRLRAALRDTKIEWKPIPVGLGIASVGALQLYRIQARERRRQEEEDQAKDEAKTAEDHSKHPPRKRERIRPSGPWQVQIMSTLPLKGLSRLWGRFNELEIPYYLRVPGFRLYSFLFGVNLSEASETDLHNYNNLASFFYRSLKAGVRSVDPDSSALLSPADGKILQFGTVERGEVEQVKGVTYSLDALLGRETSRSTVVKEHIADDEKDKFNDKEAERADEEFAKLNGISYTLPNLFSGPESHENSTSIDASTNPKSSSEAEVRADLALGDGSSKSWFSPKQRTPTTLHYVVIYLAPGDYHRFHSPASWVVSIRRHFAGELYSVSPWLQKKLPGLFTLNERVVLLGRWRWGFFSFIPVGATNVGSIKINFDRELRTNSLVTDTEADKAAEEASSRGEPYSGYASATYMEASKVLGGHALKRGEEIGGFQLGSSIVLVFEAPTGSRKSLDEGWDGGARGGGWKWAVKKGQHVNYGQAIGHVLE